MRKKIISLASFFFFAYAPLSLPVNSWAGVIIIFKGNRLIEDTLSGLIIIPSMEIQVASWGLVYSSDDLLVYDPSLRRCSLYEESLILSLPDPDETITLADGTPGTLREILEDMLFVVFDSFMGMQTVEGMNYDGVPPPGNGGDITPPDTSIAGGPSGTIGNNDVIFAYTGSDNETSTSNLEYSYKLDTYDTSWSSYTSSTSKSYSDLPNGSYTFQVRAKDEAGNVDPTPASRLFTVDYTATDSDGDGIPDDIENAYCTDFNNPDTDDDTISDGVEDANHNGIVDAGETDPCNADTDGDGMSDGWEVNNSLDPLVNDAFIDSDGDGYTNLEEYLRNTDPNNPDSHPVEAMPWLPLLLFD